MVFRKALILTLITIVLASCGRKYVTIDDSMVCDYLVDDTTSFHDKWCFSHEVAYTTAPYDNTVKDYVRKTMILLESSAASFVPVNTALIDSLFPFSTHSTLNISFIVGAPQQNDTFTAFSPSGDYTVLMDLVTLSMYNLESDLLKEGLINLLNHEYVHAVMSNAGYLVRKTDDKVSKQDSIAFNEGFAKMLSSDLQQSLPAIADDDISRNSAIYLLKIYKEKGASGLSMELLLGPGGMYRRVMSQK